MRKGRHNPFYLCKIRSLRRSRRLKICKPPSKRKTNSSLINTRDREWTTVLMIKASGFSSPATKHFHIYHRLRELSGSQEPSQSTRFTKTLCTSVSIAAACSMTSRISPQSTSVELHSILPNAILLRVI